MTNRGEDLEAIDLLDETAAATAGSGVRNGTEGSPRVRSATRAIALLVAAAAALGAVVGGVVEWRFRADPGGSRQPQSAVLPLEDSQQTVVPNVFGLSPWEAQKMLAEWGLASSVNERDLPFLTEKSVVIAQEPGAGQRVAVGSIVGLRTLRDEGFSDTPLRPDKPARLGSPQDRDYPWSYAVGTFDLRCQGTRPAELVVSLERLPVAFDYAWVIRAGDANVSVPLTARNDIRSALTGATGNATKFSPTPSPDGPKAFGTAHVRFAFLPGATMRVDQLTLVVDGVPRERSYVMNAPPAQCR
jgi:hypothetical protein